MSRGCYESGQRRAGVSLPHQRLADEERVEACVTQAADVLCGLNAALGDMHSFFGKLLGEAQGCLKAYSEGPQIPVVHAVGIAAQIADTPQLFRCMDFAKHIQLLLVGKGGQPRQIRVRQSGDNQQDRICAVRASLDDLVLVEDEVLAQARDMRRL